MKQNIYFIFSFEDYLKAVNFHSSLPKDQIAFQLFYVTKIARLRKDMTPHIISDRLNEQIRILNEKYEQGKTNSNLKLTTSDSVRETMITETKYFAPSPHADKATDRRGNQLPYVLTQSKEKELKNELNYYWKDNLFRQRLFDKFSNILLICTFLILGLCIFCMQIENSNKLGISWEEYREKSNWDDINNYDRSIYMLYYITNVIQFNDDMTPEVLSDRLLSLKYGYTSPDSIRDFLERNKNVIHSRFREDAFVISPEGEKVISKKVGIVSPYIYDGNVTLSWICKNEPEIIGAFGSFLAILAMIIGLISRYVLSLNRILKKTYDKDLEP